METLKRNQHYETRIDPRTGQAREYLVTVLKPVSRLRGYKTMMCPRVGDTNEAKDNILLEFTPENDGVAEWEESRDLFGNGMDPEHLEIPDDVPVL